MHPVETTPHPSTHKQGKQHSGKTIFALSACMALQMTSFVIILPLFARRFSELGAGVEALGISAMAYAITSTLAAPLMGALADRFGRRPLVLVSLIVYGAAYLGYLLATSIPAFIGLRGLSGIATAGLIPAVTGLVADLAPSDRRAQWIGFMNAGASIGWIAGPIAGGMLYDQWGYRAALSVSLLLAIITLLAALLSVPGTRPSLKPSLSGIHHRAVDLRPNNLSYSLANLRRTLPDPLSSFLILLFIIFAVFFTWTFIEPRFMFYVYNELGWSSSMLGLMMSSYGIAMMIGELTLGRLSDLLGRKPVIIFGLVLFSAQFFGLAFFRTHLLIGASFVIAGLGNAIFDPALSASILDISPSEHSSRILGVKSMVGSLGSILGPALITLVNTSLDARTIFLVAGGVVVLSILTALAYPARSKDLRREPAPVPAWDIEGPTN
jgi:MFS transporter, DHA1 family, multidrug resistance protein